MVWTNNQIKQIVAELAQDDILACRALLEISHLEFTEAVDTFAVSLKDRPALFINVSFCNQYLETEQDIKTVLMHEFLHVLLGHTLQYKKNTPLLNIATDAIINAFIHRQYGATYSNLFNRLYPENDIRVLLRPQIHLNSQRFNGVIQLTEFDSLHWKIYDGEITANDLFELLQYLHSLKAHQQLPTILLLGNHDETESISPENKRLLNEIVQRTRTLIFSKNENEADDETEIQEKLLLTKNLNKWKCEARQLLQRCLHIKQQVQLLPKANMLLPVLNTQQRKAMAMFLHFPLIPLFEHPTYQKKTIEKTTVFLDVSGSMNNEIQALATLLFKLREHIVWPLLSFSSIVKTAELIENKLTFETDGGTSIACVFNYIRTHRIKKSLIVTDGYIEEINPNMIDEINPAHHCFLISQQGSQYELQAHGFPFHKLSKWPN